MGLVGVMDLILCSLLVLISRGMLERRQESIQVWMKRLIADLLSIVFAVGSRVEVVRAKLFFRYPKDLEEGAMRYSRCWNFGAYTSADWPKI
jgi:hypothetical protein